MPKLNLLLKIEYDGEKPKVEWAVQPPSEISISNPLGRKATMRVAVQGEITEAKVEEL